MKVLITGGNGFVAGYVAKELADAGHTPVLSDRSFCKDPKHGFECIEADLTKQDEVDRLVAKVIPDACIHMGGITSVVIGSRDPAGMFDVNVKGTAILLEAIREHCPAAKVLFVSTSFVYGQTADDSPLKESTPVRPANLYAASKASAELIALTYVSSCDMYVMTTRPNNHVGPGQSRDFVLGAFSEQIKAIARGQGPSLLKTGNLESTRDFSDVRDVARAYRLLIEKGVKGCSYNIGSGKQHSIGEILELMCSMEGISPDVEQDPALLRPADRSPNLDTSLIKQHVGWIPEIPFDQTIRDILREF